MTPEQLQELDNIKNVAASLGNDVANLLVDMSENILLSEELLRASLTDVPPPPTPTYQLLAVPSIINEGESSLITLKTTNVAAGTQVFFNTSGTISVTDLTNNDINFGSVGAFTVGADGNASILITATNDLLTEGVESLNLTLRDVPGFSVNITINDTSVTPPPPVPTYNLSASILSIAEGETVRITLNTTNVVEGTSLPYVISGVSSSDINQPLTSSFVINAAGVAFVDITAINDLTTEGNENLKLTLSVGPSIIIEIRDTSVAPPPPPPDPTIGVVVTKTLNIAALIMPESYTKDSMTYERWQIEQIENKGTNYIYNFRVASDSSPRPFRTTPYRLYIDDVEVQSKTIPAGNNIGSFTVNTSALAHGYHKLEIFGAADETSMVTSLFVKEAGAADPVKMLVTMGSHDCQHGGLTRFHYAWVPYKHEPTARPFVLATRENFSTALGRASLIAKEIVPVRRSDIYRPRMTDGVLHTCNSQNYLINPLMNLIPDKALLDGPRGVGTVNGATHLQVGRVGGIYFCEAWRIGHISTDGTIRTIAGLRSRNPADKHRSPVASDYDLVGNWSAVPASRRGFHEIWGLAFWQRSLMVDETADAIPNNGTLEKPHVLPGPVAFVPDSQFNRIVKLQFSHNNHDTPVIITEFITGLSDPWDCVEHNDVLYVSERTKNRISKWNALDGTYLGNFKTGPTGLTLANLASDRRPVALASLATIQAQDCVLPEGLFILDGHLYMGSQVMQQVRKWNIDTGALVFTLNFPPNFMNGYYIKPTVSDGTFGPRGTIFACGWGSNTAIYPPAWLPDGTKWNYDFGEGPGKVFDTVEYLSAAGVGKGILVAGSSLEGITIIRKSQPGEKSYKWAEGYKDALDEWQKLGYTLVHGKGGFGHYNLPLPWGVNTKIDYYLEMYGHEKPV